MNFNSLVNLQFLKPVLAAAGRPFLTKASPLAYTTERIFGQDRIEIALSIAQEGWTSAQTVILCGASADPDSIAAAPFAPILLTGGKSLDSVSKEHEKRLSEHLGSLCSCDGLQ